MKSPLSAGRTVGALLLVHLATGLITPYVLLLPISAPPAGFLTSAAAIPQARVALALLFVGGAAPVAVSVAAWPVLRRKSPALGLWLLTLAVANFILQVVENQHWFTMLFLSEAFSQANATDAAFLTAAGATIRTAWRSAHYTHLLVVVGWMFLLCATLYRLSMVPRPLAGVGLVTTLLQITGISLPVLFGYRVPLRMEFYGMPLGAAYVLLAAVLIVKGFRDEHDRNAMDSASR